MLVPPRFLPVALAFALAFVALAPPAARADEAERIRDVFARYRQAVIDGDGGAAASLLTPETIAYYGRLQRQALFASAEQVRALPMMERVQVLFYRLHVPREELVRMSAQQVVAHAVEAGWVGRQELEQSSLGPVRIEEDGRTGWARHVFAGQPMNVQYRFVRPADEDDWHFDLLPILQASNEVMQLAAQQSGMEEEELVRELILSTATADIERDLWAPLFPDPPAPQAPPPAPEATGTE